MSAPTTWQAGTWQDGVPIPDAPTEGNGRVIRLAEDSDVPADDVTAPSVISRRTTPAGEPREDDLEPSPDLDEFLNADEPQYDYLINDLIERTDRTILTGNEGIGKSTLLRQIAVTAASGLHPFKGTPMDQAVRTLYIDLENSRRHVRRELSHLRQIAGTRYQPPMLRVEVRPEGIDLLTKEDRDWLHRLIRADRPELLVIGPLYKLAAGDPTLEPIARTVAGFLDEMRTTYGFGIFMEAHCPHATNGHARPRRPYGASLWVRWPEFGLHLAKDGVMTHWRGPRDEREWPTALIREGRWPWSLSANPGDDLWARIVADTLRVIDATGKAPSLRTLAGALDVHRNTVDRAIKKHQSEWDKLARDGRFV